MRINYGINRPYVGKGGKRKFEHVNGHLIIRAGGRTFQELTDAQHEAIRSRIRRQHPGWFLTGYAPHAPVAKLIRDAKASLRKPRRREELPKLIQKKSHGGCGVARFTFQW